MGAARLFPVTHTMVCAAPGFAEHERRDTREARMLAVRVAVPG